MAEKWYHTPQGQPALYRQGKHLYAAKDGKRLYWEQNGWWYLMEGGAAAYYLHNWVYTQQEQPAFYSDTQKSKD